MILLDDWHYAADKFRRKIQAFRNYAEISYITTDSFVIHACRPLCAHVLSALSSKPFAVFLYKNFATKYGDNNSLYVRGNIHVAAFLCR